MRQTLPHEEIKLAFAQVYNVFYLKYRTCDDKKRTDEEWENLIRDASIIRMKFNSQFVNDMLAAVIGEFEREDINKRKSS